MTLPRLQYEDIQILNRAVDRARLRGCQSANDLALSRADANALAVATQMLLVALEEERQAALRSTWQKVRDWFRGGGE